jgi:hypothetical protein
MTHGCKDSDTIRQNSVWTDFQTTRKLEYFFSPEFNISLYDKNSESHYFFFLHQNQNIFFSNIGNQNIFLEKKHSRPLILYQIHLDMNGVQTRNFSGDGH